MATLALSPAAAGASEGGAWDRAQEVDLSLGVGSETGTLALSWSQVWVAWPGRLDLGLGARLSALAGFGPVAYRSGSGPVTTLLVDDPLAFSLNLQVLAVVRLVGPLEAGFDIDLVGFSAGPRREAEHRSPDPAGVGRARAGRLDLLLLGSRDRGQLSSRLFLGWRLPGGWAARAGLGHLATEYLTLDAVDGGNRRFQRFVNQGFVAVARRW